MITESINEVIGTNFKWKVEGTGYYSEARLPVSSDPNNLYAHDHGRTMSYFLSSPTYYETAGVIYGGGLNGNRITATAILSNWGEFRPVVHLKKGYKLQWNNKVNKFDIVNDK